MAGMAFKHSRLGGMQQYHERFAQLVERGALQALQGWALRLEQVRQQVEERFAELGAAAPSARGNHYLRDHQRWWVCAAANKKRSNPPAQETRKARGNSEAGGAEGRAG